MNDDIDEAKIATAPATGEAASYLYDYFKHLTSLSILTLGGARILGRDDIGALEPGRAADFAAWDLSGVGFAGAADPVAALIFCHPVNASHVAVQGRLIVKEGQLTTVELAIVIERHNTQSRVVLSQ